MSKPNLEAFFTSLQHVNKDLLERDYFITNNLGSALQQKGMDGVLRSSCCSWPGRRRG